MNPLGDFPTVHLCWLPEIKISAPKIKDFHTWQRHLLMTAIWAGGSHISGSADWRLFAWTVSVLVSYAKQRDRLHAKDSLASLFWALRRLSCFFLVSYLFLFFSWMVGSYLLWMWNENIPPPHTVQIFFLSPSLTCSTFCHCELSSGLC